MKSQLVILAAGTGSRLSPLTNDLPKTMVKINGRSMIDYILNSINIEDFSEIIIAVGHKKEKIINYLGTNYKSLPIQYVFNPKYKETNSIYSVWLLKKIIRSDFVVINADTIFNYKILNNLMLSKDNISVVVDDYIESPLDDDAMKVTIKNGAIIDIRKTIPEKDTMGDAIGIYRFLNDGVSLLFNEIQNCLENNINDQLFTHAVNNLSSKTKVTPISTDRNTWFEIDSLEDLRLTEKDPKLKNINRD